ncbi:MAG: cobalamin biosynthesis protein CobD [Dehalococcoidia bacterium]|nr:cobalamin biosynthesis protein CobD [Dehalococcoidia bacterium]MSQ16575.1 cobalamin biosynthesis protein CobD [Dehalococcoidia bacterium]
MALLWLDYADLWVLGLAVLLDLAGRELPARLHPTVWIGKTVALADRISPKGRVGGLIAGGLIALLIPGLWAAAAWFAVQGLQGVHSVAYILVGAVWLKSTFSVRMLHGVAGSVRDRLLRGDVASVRQEMRSLVSRDVSALTAEQMTAATVESVSENTTDSFIGPWLAFALFGLPGAVAYRAVNTLDSMIGYHGKYEYLGKASARLDDLLNLAPARLSALLLLAGSALLPGQRLAGAWRIMWRDHGRTASPNAGWTMSGMAGALGVELEKVGHYRLGDPTRPLEPADITRAVQSMYLIAALGLVIAVGIWYVKHAILQ